MGFRELMDSQLQKRQRERVQKTILPPAQPSGLVEVPAEYDILPAAVYRSLIFTPGFPILGVPNSKPIAQFSSAAQSIARPFKSLLRQNKTIAFNRPFLAYFSDEK